MKILFRMCLRVLGIGLLCGALWGCVAGGITSKSFNISGDIETDTSVERTSE